MCSQTYENWMFGNYSDSSSVMSRHLKTGRLFGLQRVRLLSDGHKYRGIAFRSFFFFFFEFLGLIESVGVTYRLVGLFIHNYPFESRKK